MADAKAFLAVLDGEDDVEKLKDALGGINALLEPLLTLAFAGQPSIDALRPVARLHGSVVSSLVKSTGSRLSLNQQHSHEQLMVFAEAACLGLKALDCLRPVLKASRNDLDVQRYNFVRKMAVHGLYEHAMAQGKVLLESVAASPGTVAGPADLHIAAIANVLVCYAELVKQGASRAETLWSEIHGPVDALLTLARDAAEPHEAAKRLEPVLKCLTRVTETLQYASVVCKLSSAAVAEQLSALTLCGAVCQQDEAVAEMLSDSAYAAPDMVKLALVEALLYLLSAHGVLAESLIPMLHALVLDLAQKPVGHPSQLDDRSHAGEPLVAVIRAALSLPHCTLSGVPDEQLCTVLRLLAAAAAELEAHSATADKAGLRLRWSCLDGLRVSIHCILTQLASAPQSAGGNLLAFSQCMELLCADSLAMVGTDVTSDGEAALVGGTAALAVNVRVQVAHALCTGQLASLHQDMSRNIEHLKRLLNSPKQRQRAGGVGPTTLFSLFAVFGNAGIDLLMAQHLTSAAIMLQAAVDLGFERVRQMGGLGTPVTETDVSQLIKKCKTHVTALQQLSSHEAAMAAAATYVAKLHTIVDGRAHLLSSLTKQFVQSSVAAYDAALATALSAVAQQPSVAAGAPASAAPAAPCKAQKRGGRLQRMQTDAKPMAPALESASSAAAAQPTMPKTRTLVQSLAAAAVEKGGRPGLLNALDMYAVQELEAFREESKRREEGDSLNSLYGATVLDTLSKCVTYAGSSEALCARELVVKAMMSGASVDAQIRDLHASCELLDPQLHGIPEGRALLATELGLLDTAALAHAQLGLCLAQLQLTAQSSTTSETPTSHISKAIVSWRHLLAGHAGGDTALLLRMPHATLHAALQVQQFVHLHDYAHPEATNYSEDVVWRLVRVLGHQVKLREQHTYLLSTAMPLTTCTAWALGVQPTVPLGEACVNAQRHRKLADVLKAMEPIRDAYAMDATDHEAVAGIAVACGVELERGGFLRHGPAPLLLRSQCHQLAAAAYLRAGKTSSAYVQAFAALRITWSLFTPLDDTPLTTGPASSSTSVAAEPSNLTPAEAAAAAVKSGAATSAADYASHDDTEEQPSLGKAASSSDRADKPRAQDSAPNQGLSAGLAWAVAAAHLASLHNAARVFEAAGCVEDAIYFWKECRRTAELFGAAGVQSLSCYYLAELSCRRGDETGAASYLDAAGAVASAACEGGVGCGSAYAIKAALLAAHSCSARAAVALMRGGHCEVKDACQSGVVACGDALAAAHRPTTAGGSSNSCTGARKLHGALAWHGVCLRARLERLRAEALLRLGRHQEAGQHLEAALVQLQKAAAACSKRSAAEVWPVDYGLVLAHRAALASPSPSYDRTSIVGLGSLQPAASAVKDGASHAADSVMSDTADGSTSTDQSSKRGAKAKTGSGSSRSHAKHEQAQAVQHTGVASSMGAADANAAPCNVPALLQSLQLCWQLPLAAVYACRQLLNASIAMGMPYAATMFLHLGHGMSYAQQQAMERASARCATSSATGQPSASSDSADGAASGCKAGAQENIFPADVREAALSMLCGLDMHGASSTGSFAALETGAEAWLRQALSALPAGAVVSAIVQDSQAGQLVVGRVTRDGTPVLAVLPGSGVYAAGQQLSGRPSAGTSASQVLDRCVARLRELLDESGDSMDTDQTQGSKTKWWKTRVALDTSVKGLMQELDEQCLGPWRCLLLSVPNAHLAVWRAAADGFISERFPSVLATCGGGDALGGGRAGVLRELLTVALSGMRHLQGSDTAALLGVICGQLGVSGGASNASSLAVELAAAEAAARVQLLQLPPTEQRAGPDTATASEARGVEASPGTAASGRGAGPAAARAAGSRTAAAPTARSRAAVAAAPPQGTAACTRLGVRESTRRPGAASFSGAAESADAEKAPPDAPGRARRTTRALATQPEPPSGPAAASKTATTRAVSTRLATRRRAGAAVVAEDPPAATNKSDIGRGSAAVPAPVPEPSTSAAATPKTDVGGAAQQSAGPVLLVLSPALHALPWESIPCYHGREMFRIFSLPVACATAARPAMGAVSGPTESPGAAEASEPSKRGSSSSGDAKSGVTAFYVLNPTGDLGHTQSCLQPLLDAQPLWEGITGERPTSQALLSALQSHELYLYFGHGSGEQFLSLPSLRKLKQCAICLLMGCSSGRLRLHGAYDPSGAAVAYLLAGCPALVANLWDVTDRDIDRYCQALMHAWLGCASSQPSDASSSGAGTKSELSGPDGKGREPLGLAVSNSRTACKLPHLIGAAPVCYGLPPTGGNLR